MAEWASVHALSSRILPYQSCKSFSWEAATYFKQNRIERILLFYTRRIGEELFGPFDTNNIHPSLLPAFPGLDSVAKAMAARTGLIGATLHRVDAGLDTGQIVLQVQSPIDVDASLALAERISHVQKIWLTLYWSQLDDAGVGHALAPDIAAAFSQYCRGLEIDAPISAWPAP
jgi:phosphoribosylglycinamide formyltransferase-1